MNVFASIVVNHSHFTNMALLNFRHKLIVGMSTPLLEDLLA